MRGAVLRIVALTVSLGSASLQAHEDASPADGVALGKLAQHRAGLRTQPVLPVRDPIVLSGQVVVDPRRTARVAASQPGTIEPTAAARPGAMVKAGEILGWLTPALAVPNLNDVAAEVATAQRDTAIGRVQIDRFHIDEAPQFEAKLPTPTLQVLTEYRSAKGRAEALETALRKPEPLRAPRSGRLLRAPATAGQLVAAGVTLFELDAPSAALVAVDTIDSDLDLAAVHEATTSDGRRIPVSFAGDGFDSSARCRRAYFEIAGNAAPLAINTRVKLTAIHTEAALLVPTTALSREAGAVQVWVHTAAERFEPRTVLTLSSDDDNERGQTRIVAGLAPGERIVTQGWAALSAAGALP